MFVFVCFFQFFNTNGESTVIPKISTFKSSKSLNSSRVHSSSSQTPVYAPGKNAIKILFPDHSLSFLNCFSLSYIDKSLIYEVSENSSIFIDLNRYIINK